MTLEEEKNYWETLVHEMSNNMDKNIFEAYAWRRCATDMFNILSEYKDHNELPKDTPLYTKTINVLSEYEKLNNKDIDIQH